VETFDQLLDQGIPVLPNEFGTPFVAECSARMVMVMIFASCVFGLGTGTKARRYLNNYRTRHFS